MGPIWGRQDPDVPHVVNYNNPDSNEFAIWVIIIKPQGPRKSIKSTDSLIKAHLWQRIKLYSISHEMYRNICCVLFCCGYIISSHTFYDIYTHILQDCFTGTETIIITKTIIIKMHGIDCHIAVILDNLSTLKTRHCHLHTKMYCWKNNHFIFLLFTFPVCKKIRYKYVLKRPQDSSPTKCVLSLHQKKSCYLKRVKN